MISTKFVFLFFVFFLLVFGVNGQENKQSKILDKPQAELIFSFENIQNEEGLASIDALVLTTNNIPKAKGLIFFYCGKTCKFGEAEAHILGLRQRLKYREANEKQIKVIFAGYREKATNETWFIPENACPPIPNSTVNIEDVKLKGNFKRKLFIMIAVMSINDLNKKELKNQYKETLQPMGVFQIRNLTNEKVFVGSSKNLDGIFNRHEFQLKMGGHPNKDLQKDWNEFGSENFAFEVLEELFPRENPDFDYNEDLDCLENLWLEQLEPYGEKGYNERKKTREERLRMIAANKQFN